MNNPSTEDNQFDQIPGHAQPEFLPLYPGVGKFRDQIVLLTGGESHIGRAIALAFANEGALIALIYSNESEEVSTTKLMVESFNGHCLLLKGDVGDRNFCTIAVDKTMEIFGRIDIVINNSTHDEFLNNIAESDEYQIEQTFRTHLFSYFFLVQAALPFIQEKTGSIINTTSDYLATSGAVEAFTRSLSESLREKGIRVNAVNPGRGGPNLMAGAFTWLASKEASCITGQLIKGRIL